MSHIGATASDSLKIVLAEAAGQIRQTTRREAWFDLGWRWLAALAAFFCLDLVFALPVPMRWAGLVGLLGFAAWRIYAISVLGKTLKAEEQHTARLLEERHPELDNALIHAVQFGKLVSATDGVQASLMRREIARAETSSNMANAQDAVDRTGELAARRLFFGFASAWVLAAVLFGGVLMTVLPRLLAPWLDDLTPPFSLTKIGISPQGANVRFGGSLMVEVDISGPTPDVVSLMTQTEDSDWRQVALEYVEPGKYAAILTDIREDTRYYATGGDARSARYLAKVLLPPAVEELKVRYDYPDYTNKETRDETVGEEGIHALRGTKVKVEILGNRALAGGELYLEYGDDKGEIVPLQADGKKAVANFTLTRSGKFRIALKADDGQENSNASKGKITAERDAHPSIWFEEPAQEILVTPKMKVRLGMVAEDDVGVRQVNLHRVINDISDVPLRVYEGAALKHTEHGMVVDLADLGVRPGDEIKYYGEALDNDPGHPNLGETEPHTMKVVSEEEYQKMLKEQRDARQLQKEIDDIKNALESLAERQEELAKKMEKLQKQLEKNPGDAAAQKAMKEAQAEQAKLQKETKEVAEKLKEYAASPSGNELDAALKKQVGELAEQMSKAANGAMQNAQSGNLAQAAQAAREAANAMKKSSGQAEQKVSKPIEHLEQVAPLFADAERFKQLLERQGQLVLQAREFQNGNNKSPEARSKLEQLAAEQELIKEELKQLQQDLRRHAEEAKKNFPKAADSAVKIADEIGRRQIAGHMQKGEEGFSDGQGKQGFDSAQKALEEMQAMVQKAGNCQGACEGELDLKLSQSLGSEGLGQCLSDLMGNKPGGGIGKGQGTGMGLGAGQGGTQTGINGATGGFTMRTPTAYRVSTRGLASKAGRKTSKSSNRGPAEPAMLAPESVEYIKGETVKPPTASDGAAGGYPAEYRKLVKDYFIAVTKEKKK